MIKKILLKYFIKYFKSPRKRDLKIFIVDDIIYYSMLVKINIEKEGFINNKLFEDGESVVEEIKKNEPDIIILDHVLSNTGLNGNDILDIVRKKYPKIKIIILSGQEDLIVATNTIKKGAYDYIIKNDLAYFNVINKLKTLQNVICGEELNKWLEKRNKILLSISILLLWILSIIFIF